MPVSPPLREQASDALPPPPARARSEWVDVAKGMGIVLVVIGHTIDGLLSAGLAASNDGWAQAHYLIYTFHMPLFFLLAGLFVQRRVAGDPGGFVRSVLTRIAWPYLLWSVIQLLLIDMLGNVVNTPGELDARRVVSLAWEPAAQFWFLQALLVLHLLSRALLPHIGAARLLGLMLLARAVGELVELPAVLGMPARFGLFYALGVLAGPLLLRGAAALPRRRAAAMVASLALVWALAAFAAGAGGQAYTSAAALPAALAGSAAVIVLATLPGAGMGRLWKLLGQASMAIFLLHVLFVAGVRITLHKLLGIEAPGLIFLLSCGAGIAGPLLVRRLALRVHAARALGLG